MIKTILSVKMECQLARSNMRWCFNSNSKNMAMKWINTDKKTWVNNNTCKKNKSQKKTQSRTKFKRLNRFVLRMMLYLVIQSFQPMIRLSIKIQLNHLNMQWICLWLSGRDHRRLFLKIQLLSCIETPWTLEISNKEH